MAHSVQPSLFVGNSTVSDTNQIMDIPFKDLNKFGFPAERLQLLTERAETITLRELENFENAPDHYHLTREDIDSIGWAFGEDKPSNPKVPTTEVNRRPELGSGGGFGYAGAHRAAGGGGGRRAARDIGLGVAASAIWDSAKGAWNKITK